MASEPAFNAPTRSQTQSTRLSVVLRTIRFQTALRDSDLDMALSPELADVDNSADVLLNDRSMNPVQLWSVMQNVARYDEAGPKSGRYKTILRRIVDTGGGRFINEPAADGKRPIDRAYEMQRCILIRFSQEFNVDLNPTLHESPIFRGGIIGYNQVWFRRIIEATDPTTLDWTNPAGRTPLYAFCRFICDNVTGGIADDYGRTDWSLRSLELLLSCVGLINPNRSCFIDDPLPPNADVDARLAAARIAADTYVRSELLPAVRSSIMLPDPICRMVVGYSF